MKDPFVAKEIFLTKGVGRHRERLASFEEALRDAKIAKYNLVYVSSIFPAGAKIITPQRGISHLKAGQILYCVLARQDTNENRRMIESLPRDLYEGLLYYERWAESLERLCVEKGLLTSADIEAKVSELDERYQPEHP